MNRSSGTKLCVALLVALLATPPAFGCSQCCVVCGPLCLQIFYDNYFDQDCAWIFIAAAQRVTVNGNGMGELYDVGAIAQEVAPLDFNQLKFDLSVVTGSDPGTERIAVEVVSTSGTILETLDTITAAGTYQYNIGDYTAYGTIKIRFRMLVLPDPGDTIYRIDNAYFWTY